VLLVGPRRDRRVLSLALGDTLTVGQPPAAGEAHQRDSGQRGEDPPAGRRRAGPATSSDVQSIPALSLIPPMNWLIFGVLE